MNANIAIAILNKLLKTHCLASLVCLQEIKIHLFCSCFDSGLFLHFPLDISLRSWLLVLLFLLCLVIGILSVCGIALETYNSFGVSVYLSVLSLVHLLPLPSLFFFLSFLSLIFLLPQRLSLFLSLPPRTPSLVSLFRFLISPTFTISFPF